MPPRDLEIGTSILDPEIAQALARRDPAKPFGMLNLLKFHARAQYPEDGGDEPCGGAEAFARYGEIAIPLLKARGAEPVLVDDLWIIGDKGEWDRAIIIRYPNVASFTGLFEDPAYRQAARHRTAALADTRLLLMDFAGSLKA
ncbi:MAG: DUF1330 domain-containing protein [Flavobacteriaceae bacterium]